MRSDTKSVPRGQIATRRPAISIWVDGFVLASLFVMTEVLTNIVSPERAADDLDSNPIKLLMTATIGVIALGAAIARGDLFRAETLRAAPLVWLTALVVLVSFLWSADPFLTIRRSAAYVLTVIALFYFARCYSPLELLKRMRWAVLASVVVSLIMVVIAPGVAIVQEGANIGAWEGGFGDKIFAGFACDLAIVTTIALPRREVGGIAWRLCWICPCLAFLVMTQSRTSWLALAVALFVLAATVMLRSPRIASGLKSAIGAVVIGVILTLAAASFTDLLPALGRTDSFSGRAALWRGSMQTLDGPSALVGHGYRSFWDTPASERVLPYIEYWETGRIPGSSHNGYLDTLLELGVIGLGLLTLFLIFLIARLWLRTVKGDMNALVWSAWLAMLALFLFENISYGFALQHTSLYWGMCILSAFSLGLTGQVRGLIMARSKQT